MSSTPESMVHGLSAAVNYSICSMAPGNFTHGLTGVNLQMDDTTTLTLWLSILAVCLIIVVSRLVQGGVSQLRHIFNLKTDSVQQAYWSRNGTWIWPWLKRRLIYAPLGKKRHNRNFQMARLDMGILPSRFHTLLLTMYILSNIIYCLFLDYKSCNRMAVLAELRGRTGHLAFVNMMPLIVFAGRNNALIPLLRVSFDTFNIFHRWIGRLVAVEAIAHTAAWMAAKNVANKHSHQQDGMMRAIQDNTFLAWGLASLLAMVFILIQASSAIRHLAYETFLHLHQALAIIAFLAAAVHGHMGKLPLTNYVYATIALWFLERAIRWGRIIYHNFGLSSSTQVTVEALSEACRVTFHLKRPWQVRPGCHVYTHFPTLTWSLSSHPFSIAWYDLQDNPFRSPEDEKLPITISELRSPLPARTSNSITLIMSKKSGMTAKLHARASAAPSGVIKIKGYLEGPYGGLESMHSYGTVILFAGGVGITHQMPHVRDLLQSYNDGTSAVRKIILVWSVRSQDAFEWIHPWMTEIFQMPHRQQVLKVLLFVTKPRHAGDVVSRSNQVRMYGGRCKPERIVEEEFEKRVGAMAVTVCGPGAFADEVRGAVREKVQDGVVDFVEESFSCYLGEAVDLNARVAREPKIPLFGRTITVLSSFGSESPLSLAIRTGDADSLRRLLDEGAKPSDDDIIEAQDGEFPEVCKVLITAGFMDINEDFEHAGDLLINMVWELKVEFVRWLLEHGADPNSGHLMADSTSALCAAAERGHLPLATMLLEHGAHVSGTAALPRAAGRGHLELVRFLLERGAAIDEVGVHDFGDRRKKIQKGTALHKATERGNIEMAQVLLDRDAGIEVRDPFDRTPLVRAREKEQDDMVEFLKSRGAKE